MQLSFGSISEMVEFLREQGYTVYKDGTVSFPTTPICPVTPVYPPYPYQPTITTYNSSQENPEVPKIECNVGKHSK